MQLPLSASALALLGVGAVFAGVLILVVLAVRRRKAASGSSQGPADRFAAREAGGAAESAPTVTPPVDGLSGRPNIPAARAGDPVRHDEPPGSGAPGGHMPEPFARPAAATARPAEVSARVAPPGQDTAALSNQAGSTRTVAAAVAQAFAVRAAAGRAPTSGSRTRPPVGEGAPEAAGPSEAGPAVDDSVASPPLAAPDAGGREPDPDEEVPPSPDGIGRASAYGYERTALADVGSGTGAPEPASAASSDGDGRAEVTEVEADGNGWSAAAGSGSNGDRPPAPASGLWTTGWSAVPPAAASERAAPAPHQGAAPPAAVVAGDGAARGSDARDRLLAVLLDDPERAVGAAIELEACLRELDRLADAVRDERTVLRDVLHRLAATGLRPDQLARLAGMPLAEVEELVGAARAEQQA